MKLASFPESLPLAGRFAGVDTETSLFTRPVYDAGRRTALSPFKLPEHVILGSIAYGDRSEVHRPASLIPALRDLVEAGYKLVFHNFVFDYGVLNQHDPGFGAELRSWLQAGRIYDTKVFETLLRLARGLHPRDGMQAPLTLEELAKTRAGLSLNKDPRIRTGYAQFLDPAVPIPSDFLLYAAQDAVATLRVFHSQWLEFGTLGVPQDPAFGPLSLFVQMRGTIGLSAIETQGIAVDLDGLAKERPPAQAHLSALETALCTSGFGYRVRSGKFAGRFRLRAKQLRAHLLAYSREHGIEAPYSDTGLLSLKSRFWSQEYPRYTGAGIPGDPVQQWLLFDAARKLLSVYLDTYAQGPRHYPRYVVLGSRTGRVAVSKPNLTQLPRHKNSLRHIIIADAPKVFVECDWKSAELVALAQVYHDRFGRSVLGDAINAGLDPLVTSAQSTFGAAEWNAASPEQRKTWRQLSKCCMYGLPGGMGARKFAAYIRAQTGLPMTESDARQLRAANLEADPQLRAYLSSPDPLTLLNLAAHNLLIPFDRLTAILNRWRDRYTKLDLNVRAAYRRLRAWSSGDDDVEIPEPPGFDRGFDIFRDTAHVRSGLRRGKASYTEQRNTPFQGLVAAAGLWACFDLYSRRTVRPIFDLCAFVHDSVLVQCLPYDVPEVSGLLKFSMESSLSLFCPDIKTTATITVFGASWSKKDA